MNIRYRKAGNGYRGHHRQTRLWVITIWSVITKPFITIIEAGRFWLCWRSLRLVAWPSLAMPAGMVSSGYGGCRPSRFWLCTIGFIAISSFAGSDYGAR
jgi:hypothetical protein